MVREAPRSMLPDGVHTGACPFDCPDTCNWQVTVKEGRAVLLGGVRENPYTRGALCVKVSKYLEYTQHPDRVLYPLARVGKKGEGRFERISWDDALSRISEAFQEAIAEHGPESIWPHQLTGQFGHIQGVYSAGHRLFNRMGASRNAITNCSVSGELASAYTVGPGRSLEPALIRHAKTILLWGANTISTNQHLRPFLEDARRTGAKIIAIDPLYTRTAEFADQHIPLVPGTDAALALGIIREIVVRGVHDRNFIETWTSGWQLFQKQLDAYDMESVADLTGVPTTVIQSLVTDIVDRKPTAIRMSQGMQRHAGGGMAVRTIMCIPAVTGDWALLGGGAAYDIGGYFGPNYEKLCGAHLRRDDSARTLTVTHLGVNLRDLKDPPVKCLYIWGGNPLASAPETELIRSGLLRPDLFTVVSDHFITETAKYADLFLPATMQTEQEDLHNGYGHLNLIWNNKICEAPGECLPNTEIFRRLAGAMGYSEPELFASDEQLARDALDSTHPSCEGITLESLKSSPFVRQNYPESPHTLLGFTTPSGKFEFDAPSMAAEGLPTTACYTPPLEVADPELRGKFPFAVISPAAHYFLNSVFGNFAPNVSRQGEPIVAISSGEADRCSLKGGDLVRVYNDRGSFVARLTTDERLAAGIAACPKGQWRGLDGTFRNVNATVSSRASDMGGGAVYNDNRVAIEKYEPNQSAWEEQA